ncbi:ABC transporter ATP-binding protein [Priestia sp. FSL R5-0597]|uniref:ABC transporter ATP-binding protein n=1 Tax=Priestia TaxID=2800373 RepID=UPI0012B9B252|nr:MULTISPECIES: ABC transporter ATP-binding protein [Priestia]MED4156306.1 ABC transporter ATP-binding protein [Priestia aryabhattai]
MKMAIRTHNLTKTYGRQTVVNNLNLEINEGQIYGFLGPNGAGKTTTIRMLLGLITPNSGQIEVFGKSLKENRQQILRQVGAFIDSPAYYGHLTGYENLQVIQKMLGNSNENILPTLDIVGLSHAKNKLVKEYSLGMRQRLGIAFALLNNPKLLILDEPTNGLDPSGIHEIRELIKNLAKNEGHTILVSSHNLNEIELMASHVGMIQKGHLIYQGSLDSLFSQQDYQIEIGTTDILKAEKVLKDKGYNIQKERDLLITKGTSEDIIHMNQLIVNNGNGVYHLYQKKNTLEDIFLSLTSGKSEAIE